MENLLGTEFTTAQVASVSPVSGSQAVHIIAIDLESSSALHAQSARFISSIFNAAPELGSSRDAVVLLAVGGATHDLAISEVLATTSSVALSDATFERAALGRLATRIKDHKISSGGASATVFGPETGGGFGEEAVERAQGIVKGVSEAVRGKFGAARVHLYFASSLVCSVSEKRDIPFNAFPDSEVCYKMHLFTCEKAHDASVLFGEVFARMLSSRVTLRIGNKLLQLLARPRIRGSGCLPASLVLTGYYKVGIDSVPEDLLFGIPTALLPDYDAEQDSASRQDWKHFKELAETLSARREALVVVERNGPHLVALPAAKGMLLLREIASKETILPGPTGQGLKTTGDTEKSAVDICIEGSASYHIGHGIIDEIALSAFNPLELDGAGFTGSTSYPRSVAFSTDN